MIRLLGTVILLTMVGCGGGESSDDVIQNLDGVWRGNLALTLDQCTLVVDPLVEVHEVAIGGDQVTLMAQDGRVLLEGEVRTPRMLLRLLGLLNLFL